MYIANRNAAEDDRIGNTHNKKLGYRRVTARCIVLVEILPITTSATVQKLLVRQVLNKSKL